MRHGATGRRSRNRGGNGNGNGNGRRGGQNRNQVFDSNGPDVRIRGTAHQIHEKYAALAKDASSSGDYILAESYMQHAEHYMRVINSWQDELMELEANGWKAAPRAETSPARTTETHASQDDGDDMGLPASITGQAGATQKEQSLEDA